MTINIIKKSICVINIQHRIYRKILTRVDNLDLYLLIKKKHLNSASVYLAREFFQCLCYKIFIYMYTYSLYSKYISMRHTSISQCTLYLLQNSTYTSSVCIHFMYHHRHQVDGYFQDVYLPRASR